MMNEKENLAAIHVTLKKGVPTDGTPPPALPSMSQEVLIFKGDADSPLLAPRGVCMAGGRLFVSDTGQNRVFLWNTLPQHPHTPPDIVLGQTETSATGRNAGEGTTANSLMYPSGIWSDGERLVVADAWNHRVLIWHTLPTAHGQAADVVVGQPDFTANAPNVKGIGQPPTAQTLNWPYGVSVHEGRLFIADTGNRRVLVFEQLPTSNFAAADAVIGKPNMNERDYESDDPIWPYSVKISAQGQLAITDTQYYRVLLWTHWRDAMTQKANTIVGQSDLEQNGQNQFGLFPAAHTLNWCYDSAFYGSGLLVADTGNSRILWFAQVPDQSNAAADNLIGKPNFQTGSENAATVWGTEQSLYWPFSVSVDAQRGLLAIADTGNHRIIFHQLSTVQDES